MSPNSANPVYVAGRTQGFNQQQIQSGVIELMAGADNAIPSPTSGLDLLTGDSNVSNAISAAVSSLPNFGPLGYIHDSATVVGSLVQGRDANTYAAAGGGLGSAIGGLAGGVVGAPAGPIATYALSAFGAGLGTYVGAEVGYSTYINNNAPSFLEADKLPPTYVNPDGTPYWVLSTVDSDGDPFTFVYTRNPNPAYVPGAAILPIRDAQVSDQIIRASLLANGIDPDITREQLNLRNGHSVSGYAPGSVHYETPGSGSGSEQIQVTTYRDRNTGAIVEARLYGSMTDGVFTQSPGAVPVASGYTYSEDSNHKPIQTHVSPPIEEVLPHVFPSLDPTNYSNEGLNHATPVTGAESGNAEVANSLGESGHAAAPPPPPPPPRPDSTTFVESTGAHLVVLSAGGTLSDIVLLQGRAGNSITVADLLAANPQYTDVTKIPVGATLNVPVRSGDILTIYQSSGAVDVASRMIA